MASAPTTSATALDQALVDLATSQHGVLSTAQLRAAGHDARALVHLVATGALSHPGRGLYVVRSQEETEDLARHRQLVAGVPLLYDDAVLVGSSAVLAHGGTVWGADIGRPALRRPIKRSGGMSAFWVRPDADTSVPTGWGAAEPLPDALAQLALDYGIVAGVVSADRALHDGAVTPEQLGTAVQRVAAWPLGSRAVAMREHSDGRRESVGESRCGVGLALAGIDATPQVEIHAHGGRLVARVDFLVDGTNVVVEFDGRVKYADGDPEVLWREKRREDELRGLGYVVVRVTWADLERPGALVAKVRAALGHTA
ncbi:type IV toxin-antitoxin system AbiEi family antitoxin domain-containing protein [Phycicoccus sp. CSK15P-2]|uniref:type IV toxin-antitoxin system AbiEi family antitoxin domain-containing protein n=1 Tax=Phycicoccus sp. CSK15P-2 TaxID=2807627 RepID=UPI00194F2D9F|nr:type IV toxin-antitoxin system AbiEi family antitoxin domain-containing protein [Phycicoccus sp. CSK15P-2]MBM6402863.1 type IV toxin-antitoxin system AbiEi family antitoxin domain-containing protein [Phycicoccus sp. CSK15P-2]